MTSIEWTNQTWNPVTGCDPVSPGCAHCYAADVAKRFWGDRKFSDVQFHPDRLEQPRRWRKPRMVFVNSMSDLFHESVTDEQLDQIFAVMALTPQHTYQVLTKRPERMLEYFSKTFGETIHDLGREKVITRRNIVEAEMMRAKECPDEGLVEWPLPNVWLGVTCENQRTADERREHMQKLAEMGWFTWVSHEPALELVNFSGWEFIEWLVMGGESGPKARSYDLAWPRSVSAWCKESAISFFHKQLGAYPIGLDGETSIIGKRAMPFGNGAWRRIESSKGNNPDEWPEDLRVREFPPMPVNA